MNRLWNTLAALVLVTASLWGTPVTITKTDGTRLIGEVVSKTAEEVVVRTEDGVMRIAVAKLTPDTKARLALGKPPDAAELQAKVAELQQLVDRLKEENQKLREQLFSARAVSPKSDATVSEFTPSPARGAQQPSPRAEANGYWISSTGKRHNSSCRYYSTSKGRTGGASEGVGCKICGG